MPKPQPNWIITALIPLLICGFCIITGTLLALAGRRPDEFGIGNTPGNNWSFLWIGIAITIFITIAILAVLRLRK